MFIWSRLLCSNVPSLAQSVLRTCVLYSSYDGCSLLITFIGSKDPLAWRGYMYVAAMFIVACTRTVFSQNHWHVGLVTGMRLRTAIVGVIYRKVRRFVFLHIFARWLQPIDVIVLSFVLYDIHVKAFVDIYIS